MSKPASLTTQQLVEIVENQQAPLVDVRPIEAYNGWQLKGEARGGHIPGARNIPLKWTRYMDWIEVLDEKGIRKESPVVLYGYSEEETEEMAGRLYDLGYKEVSVYNHFVDEWTSDPSRRLERLPRYKDLVYPGWVDALVSGEKPEGMEGDRFVICHSHYDHIEDYYKGHIPGAIPVDTNSLESTETWNRRSPEELEESLTALGIDNHTTVILYGRFASPDFESEAFPGKSAGHLGAIRSAALMLYAGVKDVKILNGGITSWEIDGYSISTEEVKPEPVDSFGAEIPGRPDLMIDTPQAKQLIESEKGELVSIRSWEEFIGNSSGYHYIEKRGRIPGAIFGNCGSDAYHMENYRNFDHTMREFHEVASAWNDGGISPEKKVAFYCGTGWRGSEAFMNAWLMGWPRVSVYDGGWYEWCSDPENPIETGNPEPSRLTAAMGDEEMN